MKLDPRYKKCVMVDDLAVVGSAKVSDYAMLEAAYLVGQMLKGRDDIRHALAHNKVRVAIMAASEFTTDIPEHSDLRRPNTGTSVPADSAPRRSGQPSAAPRRTCSSTAAIPTRERTS